MDDNSTDTHPAEEVSLIDNNTSIRDQGHSQTNNDATNNDVLNSSDSHGSTVGGAIYNFTNCILGAGVVGIGGGIAQSGGIISILSVVTFAIMTKFSLDIIIKLSICNEMELNRNGGFSYEALGKLAFGGNPIGYGVVLVSKFLYSFGCLVSYVIVAKDNFPTGLQHIIYGGGDDDNINNKSWFSNFLYEQEGLTTWILSGIVILPLCLLRDMTPLSGVAFVKVASMIGIVFIVLYIYIVYPNVHEEGGSVYEDWFQIRPGIFQSLGTFVFCFVSQHTVHITYESLKVEKRNYKNWKIVSLWSILISTFVTLSIGIFVYITFWETASSDMFEMYPSSLKLVDFSKILLVFTMLVTFPMPFFSCREQIIAIIYKRYFSTTSSSGRGNVNQESLESSANNDNNTQQEASLQESNNDNTTTTVLEESNTAMLQEPLLQPESNDATTATIEESNSWLPTRRMRMYCSCFFIRNATTTPIFIPGEEKQLSTPYHVILTVTIWFIATLLAVTAPSLGDVLDLVGCATGTLIAFILPAIISFKLQGYTHVAAFILLVGGIVGFVGTFFAIRKLVSDI